MKCALFEFILLVSKQHEIAKLVFELVSLLKIFH